jgi:hypothetical protein
MWWIFPTIVSLVGLIFVIIVAGLPNPERNDDFGIGTVVRFMFKVIVLLIIVIVMLVAWFLWALFN